MVLHVSTILSAIVYTFSSHRVGLTDALESPEVLVLSNIRTCREEPPVVFHTFGQLSPTQCGTPPCRGWSSRLLRVSARDSRSSDSLQACLYFATER